MAVAHTLVHNDTSGSSTIPRVFAGVSLGADDPTRHIIIAIMYGGSSISSVPSLADGSVVLNIGGTDYVATRLVPTTALSDRVLYVDYWRVVLGGVDTGTSGTLTITQDTTAVRRWAISVYRVTGASETLADYDRVSGNGSSGGSFDLSGVADGLILAAVCKQSSADSVWVSPLVEDYEATGGSNHYASSAAYPVPADGTTTVAVNVGLDWSLAGISLQPTGGAVAGETRVDQAPLLIVYSQSQDTIVTQVPVIVLTLPKQGTQVTQLPLAVAHNVNALPLPKPIVPEVPVIEVWEYLTTVTIKGNGREQRQAVRGKPRYQLGVTVLLLDDSDRRIMYNYLRKFLARDFTFPMYQYSTRITADASAGATKLLFNPLLTDLRAGEELAFFDPSLSATYYATISTVDSDGATLDSGLELDVGAGWYVCPALTFRIVGNSLNMRNVAGDLSLELVTNASRSILRPGATATLTTAFGLPVLDKMPRANEGLDEELDQNVDWRDNNISAADPFTYWDIPFVSGRRTYVTRRADMDYWRKFADTMKGRRGAFLLPTYRNDLELMETPDLGSKRLKVTTNLFHEYWNNAAYRYVRIVTANGVIYRQIADVQRTFGNEGYPEPVDVVLTTALGLNAGDNEISTISFANLVRLDSDKIELEHLEHDTLVKINFRTVNG